MEMNAGFVRNLLSPLNGSLPTRLKAFSDSFSINKECAKHGKITARFLKAES